MFEVLTGEGPQGGVGYDKVTQASLNGIYVKAQELDRGQGGPDAPDARPPGAVGDASAHASDAGSHASTHASDSETHASDSESRASARADGGAPPASE